MQTLQALGFSECQGRLEFPPHVRSQSEGPKAYLRKLVFSGEWIFRLNGYVKKQNVQIWASERPTQVNQAIMNRPSAIFWCGITKQRVLGPFFENGSATGEKYTRMLIDYAFSRFA